MPKRHLALALDMSAPVLRRSGGQFDLNIQTEQTRGIIKAVYHL